MLNNVWICPTSPDNVAASLDSQMVSTQGATGHFWAMNAKRTKSYSSLQVGDVCIFINSHKGQTQCRVAFVIDKFIAPEMDAMWPFKSPSGENWTLAFQVSSPRVSNMTYQRLRELWYIYYPLQQRPDGKKQREMIWQSQTLVPNHELSQLIINEALYM